MTVISQVIDQHVEEAAILWLRRNWAVSEPHFTLEDLALLDGQLEAHLDGIRVAEADVRGAAWQICERELAWNGAGEVFPAAILAWNSNAPERTDRVKGAATQSHDRFRALVSSLGWLTEVQAQPHIDRLLASGDPFERRVGIAVCAVRGLDPGERLAPAATGSDVLLQARALRAIGELARFDLLPAATQAMDSPQPEVRLVAAWSVARLTEDEGANQALQESVHQPGRIGNAALQLALRRMNSESAAKWLNELAQTDRKLVRTAIIGTGILGLPSAIPWLLHTMNAPALARIAGEAFTMITGIDLAAAKLEANEPEGFTAGPTEDPTDDNVAMDPDENLPWPDAKKLGAWWDSHKNELQPGTRHLCGQPLTDDWLEEVLCSGYQRQRAAAALELALRRPDQPLFNVRAPGNRQQALLGLR